MRKYDEKRVSSFMFFAACFTAGATAYAMLFVKNIDAILVCHVIFLVLGVIGVLMALKYLFGSGFSVINDNSFAYGVMLTLMAILGFYRTKDIVVHFDELAGMATLVMGVYLVQDTIDLARVGNWFWKPMILLSIIAIGAAMAVLMNVSFILSRFYKFAWWALLVSSGVVVCAYLIARLAVRGYQKKQHKKEDEERTRILEEKKRKEEEAKEKLSQLQQPSQAQPSVPELPMPAEVIVPEVVDKDESTQEEQ